MLGTAMPTFKSYPSAPAAGTYSTQQWGGGMLPPLGGAPGPTPEQQSMQQGLDLATGLGAPQMAGLQQQQGQLQGQLGTTQAGYDLARQAAMNDAAVQTAKINLGPQYDAIARQGNLRQIAGLDTADNIAFRMLGNQFQGLDLQKLQSWQGAGRAQWTNRSDATAKGAVGSVGYNKRMTNIQQDLANQLQGIEINRSQDTLQAQQGQNDRREQQAKLRDANAVLDVKAKEYGLDRQAVQTNLQNGLARLGIENNVSVNQILDMMSSNDINQRALGEQIFRQGMEYSNFFTTLPQNTLPTNGGAGGAQGNNPVAGVAVDQFMGRGATTP